MNGIDAIGFLPAQFMPATPLAPTDPAPWDGDPPRLSNVPSAGDAFARTFADKLGAVNDKLLDADLGLQRLASGSETSLHRVMMQLEDAKLTLQLVLQVRNRLLDAYSELTRMQI